VGFDGTAVASVGRRAIANHAQFIVDLSSFEPGAVRTLPMIRVTKKSEAAGVILIRAPMRMPSHPLHTGRDEDEQQRVAGCQQGLDMDCGKHASGFMHFGKKHGLGRLCHGGARCGVANPQPADVQKR